MNYVTTNIRILEEDYLRLKNEAAKKRKSLSAVIRERVATKKPRQKPSKRLIEELREMAKNNAKYFRGLDGVKIFREMRDHAKW